MAGLKDGDDFKDGEFLKAPGLLKVVCLGAGVGFSLLFFAIALISKDKAASMAYSWLFAVVFFLTLCVGGLFWTLLHHASNSGWGTVIRRLMESLACMIPFILILGLPFLIPQLGFRDALWEWFPERQAALEHAAELAAEEKDAYQAELAKKTKEADSKVKEAKEALANAESPSAGDRAFLQRKIDMLDKEAKKLSEHDQSDEAILQELEDKHFQHDAALLYVKRGYLNEGFWYFRYFFYLAVLTAIGWILRGWSVRLDKDGDPKWFRWMRRWSCGFLPFFAVAWTFLVFDWLMALDYAWFSTMWGVYLFAGCALNSMGLLVIIVTALRRAGYLKNVVTMEHYHLMGKLMLAFVVFWAYIAFSQYFLIWYANITEETKFYLTRNTEMWNTYTITFLVIGHFFIPFAVLLIQQWKKIPLVLSGVACWNLVMHICDIYWIIIPERGVSLTGGDQMMISGAWLGDILAFLAVGGIFGFCLLKVLGSASLFPCRDPRLDESLNVVN